MGWWIYLKGDGGHSVEVDGFNEGGVIPFSGDSYEATLKVTFNYGKHFDFRSLHGKTARDMIPVLESRVKELGTKQDDDYWKPTEGNVGHTLALLLGWTRKYPAAEFQVS